MFSGEPQALSARHHHLELRGRREQQAHVRRCGEDLLEVVDDEECLFALEMTTQRIDRRLGGSFFHAQRLRDRSEDKGRVAHRGERYEEHSVPELLHELRGEAQRKSRLPGAACPGEGEEAHVGATQERTEILDLTLSANERGRLGGQVGVAEAS